MTRSTPIACALGLMVAACGASGAERQRSATNQHPSDAGASDARDDPGGCQDDRDCEPGSSCQPATHTCERNTSVTTQTPAIPRVTGRGRLKRFRHWEQPNSVGAVRVALAPGDDVVLAAPIRAALQLGAPGKPSHTLHPSRDCQIFVAGYTGQGRFRWSRCFGGGGNNYLGDLTVDGAGNIYLTGELGDTLSFGATELESAGESDLFLAKLGPRGQPEWAKRYGDGRTQYRGRLAVDTDGYLYFAGFFYGSVDLGGGPLPSNDGNCFLAKLTPEGKHVWSRPFGDHGPMIVALAVRNDRVVVAGDFARPLQLGGQSLRPLGLRDVFVAMFDTAGQHVWSRSFGSSPRHPGPSVTDVAVDPQGGTVLVGLFERAARFGGKPMFHRPVGEAWEDGSAGFVARFDPAGAHSWSKPYGAGYEGELQLRVTIDSQGHAVILAASVKPIDFGAGPGRPGAIAVALDRHGQAVWGERFASPETEIGAAAADPSGRIWVAGQLREPGPPALFLAQLQ